MDINHAQIRRDKNGNQNETEHNDSTMSFWVIPIESTAELFTIGEGLESIDDSAPLGLVTWI